MSTETTIFKILRDNDLKSKKIEKLVKLFTAYATVAGDAKDIDKECKEADANLQAIYDHLSGYMKDLAVLRRANVSTMTTMSNYFTKSKLSVIDCRQNIVGSETRGSPNEIYFLKKLYNKLVEQTNTIKQLINNHNVAKKAEFDRKKAELYVAHIKSRDDQKRTIGELPASFETDYEEMITKMEEAFWKLNKATEVDPADVFTLMRDLNVWITDYDKTREIKINDANIGKSGNSDAVFPVNVKEEQETVSLEELLSLCKDTRTDIQTSIDRLVSVSWKIGSDKDPQNYSVSTATDDLRRILTLVQALGEMKRMVNIFTTFTPIGLENPLTKSDMSAVDAVDFKNFAIPIINKVLSKCEKQKNDAKTKVTESELTAKSTINDMLKAMVTGGSGSNSVSAEELKIKYNSLIESMTKKVVESPQLDIWKNKFTSIVDIAETSVETALATVNAVTRVPITWTTVENQVVKGSWLSLNKLEVLKENPLNVIVSDWYDNLSNCDENGGLQSIAKLGRGGRY